MAERNSLYLQKTGSKNIGRGKTSGRIFYTTTEHGNAPCSALQAWFMCAVVL